MVPEDSVQFSAPRWIRDQGFASWLLVGFVLIIVGVIWLLGQTSTIVMPVILAAVLSAVAAPPWTGWSTTGSRASAARSSSCSGSSPTASSSSCSSSATYPPSRATSRTNGRDPRAGDARHGRSRPARMRGPGRGTTSRHHPIWTTTRRSPRARLWARLGGVGSSPQPDRSIMEGSDVEIGAAMADQPSLRHVCDEEQPDVELPDLRMSPTRTDEAAAQRRRSIERSSCSTAARSRRPSLTRSRPRRSPRAQRS